MLISSRRAAELLGHRVTSFEAARRLLNTGVAGEGVVVGRSVAYDEARVRELAARPWVDERELARTCPWGVHIARLSRSRLVNTARSWEEMAVEFAAQQRMPPLTAATLGVRIQLTGGLPWVATVSGFVVFGAETTGWRHGEDGAMAFDLRSPGLWFEVVARRWLATRPGHHWFLWDPWRLQQ